MASKKSILIGTAHDAADGHTRLTRGDGLHLVGGSEESHKLMQEIGIRVQEQAEASGRKLSECEIPRMRDYLINAFEKVGLK